MLISDWSSDVCSSDLQQNDAQAAQLRHLGDVEGKRIADREVENGHRHRGADGEEKRLDMGDVPRRRRCGRAEQEVAVVLQRVEKIDRASCRARVCEYV